MKKLSLYAAILSIAFVANSRGALLITEVLSSSSATNDWFEVTNTGLSSVGLTGYKMDDNSHLFSSAVALGGITSIAAGESVIFIETTTGNAATDVANFKSIWGGLALTTQVGSYNGSGAGVGLAAGGDEVNLYDSVGTLVAAVSFSTATSGVSFGYDYSQYPNQAGFTHALSAVGVNGGYTSVGGTPQNIGSPGAIPEPSTYALLFACSGLMFWVIRRKRMQNA